MTAPNPETHKHHRRFQVLALVIGTMLLMGAATAVPVSAASDPIFKNRNGDPAAVAHRGASAHAPENTLTAFELAIRQGADFIELDVQQSSDGELFVFHDPHNMTRTTNVVDVFPDRQSDQPGEFTLAEIKQLDAGSWNDEDFAGEEVPTLEETLAVMRPPTGLLIELKNPSAHPGIEASVAHTLAESDSPYLRWAKSTGNLLVASIDHSSAESYSHLDDVATVGALAAPAATPDEELQEIATFADFIGTGDPAFSQEDLDRIHGFGLEALTNTSTAADMVTMIERGVDGAITDYPDRMLDAVAGRLPVYIEGEDLYETVESTGPVDIRENCCMRGGKWSGDAELRLRPDGPGNWMSVEFEVDKTGVYDLAAVVSKGKNYGVHQASLNGVPLAGPFDAYRPSVVRETVDWGRMELEAGRHILRFELLDQHPDSGGYYASIDVIELERVR